MCSNEDPTQPKITRNKSSSYKKKIKKKKKEERYFFLEHKGKEMMSNERESEGRRLTAFVW